MSCYILVALGLSRSDRIHTHLRPQACCVPLKAAQQIADALKLKEGKLPAGWTAGGKQAPDPDQGLGRCNGRLSWRQRALVEELLQHREWIMDALQAPLYGLRERSYCRRDWASQFHKSAASSAPFIVVANEDEAECKRDTNGDKTPTECKVAKIVEQLGSSVACQLRNAVADGFQPRIPQGWQFTFGGARAWHTDLAHLGDLILTITLEGDCHVQVEDPRLQVEDPRKRSARARRVASWRVSQHQGDFYAIWGPSRVEPNEHCVEAGTQTRLSITLRFVKGRPPPWSVSWEVEQACEANFGAGKHGLRASAWFRGKVVVVCHKKRCCDVRYDDGDYEAGVLWQHMRPASLTANQKRDTRKRERELVSSTNGELREEMAASAAETSAGSTAAGSTTASTPRCPAVAPDPDVSAVASAFITTSALVTAHEITSQRQRAGQPLELTRRRMRASEVHLCEEARSSSEEALTQLQMALETHLIRCKNDMKRIMPKELSKPLTIKLRRSQLAADMLFELHKLTPSHKLFSDVYVVYEGERGMDDGGLKVDMLTNFHTNLHHHPATARFFQCSKHSASFLVVPDAQASGLAPLRLPYEDAEPRGASSDGGAGEGNGAGSSSGGSVGSCGGASALAEGGLPSGTPVTARFKRGTKWYPGKVNFAHPNGTYAISYDDGDYEESVEPRMIKVNGMALAGGMGSQGLLPSAKRKKPNTVNAVECNAAAVYRLCGRLLALALVLGDGFFVDDCMPLYIFEFLSTDNTVSLNQVDKALDQLSVVDPPHANMLQCVLTDGVAAAAEPQELPCLHVCHLYEYSSLGVACPDGDRTVLTDENVEAAILDTIRYLLVGCRRHNLEALRRGFQGLDQPDSQADRGSAYDFSTHLACFSPSQFAERLRGRPVSEASELVQLLSFPERADLGPEVEKACAALPSAEVAAFMREWLEEIVGGFNKRLVQLCLLFVAGKRTLSALRSGDHDRETLAVCLYTGAASNEAMTAQTCSRIWYVPWTKGMTRESLAKAIKSTLDYFELQRTTGSATLDYE